MYFKDQIKVINGLKRPQYSLDICVFSSKGLRFIHSKLNIKDYIAVIVCLCNEMNGRQFHRQVKSAAPINSQCLSGGKVFGAADEAVIT